MKKTQRYLGFLLLIAILCFGMFFLSSSMLYFRLLAGCTLGYALSRGYMGFAGSVNRAYATGSTKLMRTLMFLFFVTALLSTAVLFNADATTFDLWVNPVNLGLILGGLLFGFGMTFSSCCASGVLTDLVSALPRALITLVFFCAGVFVGFPLQNTQKWITDSWFTSKTGEAIGYKGVYFPDWFAWDGLGGYLGALILTGILCLIVVLLSYAYENKRKAAGTYSNHFSENAQQAEEKEKLEDKHVGFFTEENYRRMFVRSWSMKKASMVIAGVFVVLMGVTKAGWGASTPYGFWFGKALMLFGVDAESIAAFTHGKPDPYVMPFFEHPINVQNVGIVLGTLFFLLTAGIFADTFKASLKISGKQACFYVLGGFLMGFGTRLSNGCNVGALYTPIANFSLSGWVFLIFLVVGGICGNMVAKKAKL
ncbi:MAG TPA: YeeE/YedE family protein [Lachnospiraceae bacterium]